MAIAITFAVLAADLAPSAQYSLWAQELGVSDTATLAALDGDDAVRGFTLATGCLDSAARNAEMSTEGLVGWSGAVKLNRGFPNWFSRMYYLGSVPPDCFIAFRFEGNDCRATGVKLQMASGITILTGHITKLSTSGEDIEFALRFPANSTQWPELLLKVVGLHATLYAVRGLGAAATYGLTTLAAGTQARWIPQETTVPVRRLPIAIGRRLLIPEHAAALKFNHRGLRLLTGTRSHYYHGGHRIQGTVKEKGLQADVPVSRRVLLIDERTWFVVRAAWSDAATGAYAFERINPDIRYVVMTFDHNGNYRAVVADNLHAEPMP